MAAFAADDIKEKIRAIPDFPQQGILFRDITPLLLDAERFHACIHRFAELVPKPVDYVISIESRGFIFGSALAYALKAGFVPVRKAGKLPHKTFQTEYELEYGRAVLEIHADAMHQGATAIIIDDVLATGGTVRAAVELVKKFGVKLAGVYVLIELTALKGRTKLHGIPVHALISY